MLLFMFFLILQTLDSESAAAPKANCQINLDSTLFTNSSWLSPSGLFAFGFYPEGSDGFKVGIQFIESPSNTTVIWTSNRDGSPVSRNATLKFGQGGLRLFRATSQGEDQNIVNLDQTSSAHCASMLDSGNFIIYDSNSSVLWQTFDTPTDTLMVGQVLSINTELISSVSEMNHSSGRFRLLMQSDSNAVMYPVGTDDNAVNAYWSSETYLQGQYSNLNLSQDGILFITNYNQSQRKNLTQGDQSYNPNTLHLARLESNGMLYVYAYDLVKNTSAVLDKKPDDQCEVKGICGLNSYCTLSGGNHVCLCLPYFDKINDEDTQAGCQRNFIFSTCLGVGDKETYYNTMDYLENVQLLTEPLSPTETSTSKEDCRQSCLDDCNCDVAIYNEDYVSCSKQSLPLKYGSKSTDTKNIVFIKRTARKNTTAGGLDAVPSTRIKKELSGGPLIVFITVVSGLIIFILVLFFIVFKCQAGRYRMIWRSKELALTDEIAPRSFSYYELYEATEGYKEEVGKGAFGTVFRGTLPSTGMLVAVKRLEKVVE
ncbi:G-type lectin S-receptor-like serine/threonine-protein kinase LECRK3 [Dioscorea cayenensis subsp. rotundata]|uniref:G-type lectin S-receptor-like serine/threonine-protein kinase LECRK3 n=1 Tax=Dioscorea cayennensis subsp. rotundata TaxID=55577 RepID=A0AB40BBX7_DIOCR|nr:G-type lectin S-receptor-like serine/threonine-protein kinase LECRK3 [Dioscorea cayenensis subsp. rotundata]